MKKIMPIIILMLLTSVFAIPQPPMPIGGKIFSNSGQEVAGLTVQLTNKNTDDVIAVKTTEAGEWLVDWANTPSGYRNGDDIKIVILECEDYSVCREEVEISGVPIFVQFDVTEASILCPVCSECPECEKCLPFNEENCFDNCFEYFDCDLCDCPTPTTIACPDCPECPEPEGFLSLLQVVISVVFSLAVGSGIGFTISRRKDTGKLNLRVTRHKHKNYERLHSIWTVHDKEPHKRGEINPKYDENGKYIPSG